MDERPDLDRFVAEESERVRRSRSRFLGWSLPRRLLVTVVIASLLMSPGAALVVVMNAQAGKDGSVALVAIAVLGVGGYAAAIFYAVQPDRATRWSLRTFGSYPIRAPGYGTWQGDRREGDGSKTDRD